MDGVAPVRHDGPSDAPRALLCHGFTGSPQSLSPWAAALTRVGCTVRVPLLPGHGTCWQDLNRTGWQDWYACVERSLLRLASGDLSPGDAGHNAHESRRVIVGGLSVGGALALRLAQQHPDKVAGVMLVNPAVRLKDPRLRALPVLWRVKASIAGVASDIAKPGSREIGYDRVPLQALHSSLKMLREVRDRLPEVTSPLLIMHSSTDHVVPTDNAALIERGVSSASIETVELRRSLHVATLDFDAETINDRSAQFVRRLSESARMVPS